MIQRTLVLLKSDAIKRCLVGRILQRFEDAGLKIVGMKMVWIDKKVARKHYKEHVKKKFFKSLEKYITSGPLIAICLEGVNAVEVVRKMVGSTEPNKALPGTIRGDFAHLSAEWANKKGKAIVNLIHASDSLEKAKQEIKLWFKPKELHTYKTVHEEFVF
ncbi:MAG TPA: nucleoside-diphosphate kinase [Candidatus Pacearchaeota archaeon]|nr:nucleoside-diphosphate kinase [Candidatus Pacearchaeota archaeon]